MAKSYNTSISRDDLGPLIQDEYSQEIVTGAASQSVVLTQGRRLPDMQSGVKVMPVIDQLPVAYFNNAGAAPSDDALKATSEAIWADKKIHAEELAVIVPIPESVMDDSKYDIWGQIQPLITEAIGEKIDAAVMFGDNAPNAWPTDIAHAADAAGNYVDADNGDDIYDQILAENGVFAKVEEDGYSVSGNYAPPKLKASLRGLRDTAGQPVFQRAMDNGQNVQAQTNYELAGTPIFFANNGAYNNQYVDLISGAFNQLVYSIRQDITVKVITEGVITNSSKNIVFNLPQQDMIALRVVMRLGWQVPNPPNYLNTDDASRYPFAILSSVTSSGAIGS